MKLHSLKLTDFRGYKETEVIFDSSFTTFIGKNDVGKSTILEALEIFFNNDTIKIDIEDCNISSHDKEITIEASFDLDKYEYTVDTIPTDLKKEYLLDNDRLTIRKKWNCTGKSLTTSSLKTFIVADYPVDLDPLINLKIADLKKELEKYKDINSQNVNKAVSSSIRIAIYDNIQNAKLKKIEIPLEKEDGKKIWDSLKNELPLFCLFQADRQNKDSDKEIQDPLKAITRTAIAGLEKDLERIKNDIQKRAEKIGEETLEKLKEMNPEIAKILKPEISHRAWDSLFSFTFQSDDGISINKRGSGVRRLIMLNYLRAQAERKNENSRTIIYAIEEPETSQHPDWQIKLIDSLIQLSLRQDVQVMITTHSPYLAKVVKLDAVRFVTRIAGNILVKVGGPEIIEDIINTLGMLPEISEKEKNLLKVVLCLEGPTDVKFFNKVDEHFDVDLENDPRIMVLTVGGSTVKDWVNRDCLKKMNKKEIHIYDRDDDHKYEEIITSLSSKPDVFATLTRSLSIECYYHPAEIFKSIENTDSFFSLNEKWQESWSNLDVSKGLSLFLREKKLEGMRKETIKKKIANYTPVNKTQLEELEVFDEVNSWFEKIREYIES